MKKFIKVVLVIIVLFGAVFGYAYMATGEARQLGNEFVEHLSKNETSQAYSLLHKNLKAKISYDQFVNMVQVAHLNNITMVRWHSFKIKNGIQTISGDATAQSGDEAKARIKVTALENDGAPGILAFKFDASDDDE